MSRTTERILESARNGVQQGDGFRKGLNPSYGLEATDCKRDGSLTVGKLIFGDYTLDLVRLDAISKTSVGLDGHALHDGVDFRLLDLHATLWTLTAMKHGCI